MQHSTQPRFFLIDGMALAYRVYFAFARNPLINSKGENVSAVYGFTNTLLNILDNENPDYFAVVFDTPEPTFRHKLYAEYKAQRAEMPHDMIDQLPRLREMLDVLKIPVVEKPGFEADDIIGTYARLASEQNIETIIVSGDKDMMQLVNEHVKMLNPKGGGQDPEWLDAQAVEEKTGLPPSKIIDYLALMGDSSDNIPGVPGIGPKSALKLLQEYGSIEAVLGNIENISDKRARTALEKSPESAEMSKKLTAIQCDVPVDLPPAELKIGDVDREAAFTFFQRMQFRSLADRFAPEQPEMKREYHLIQTETELHEMIEKLTAAKKCAFDTETTHQEPMRAELVGLSFSCQDGIAYYIPVRGSQEITTETKPLDLKFVLSRLKPIFEDESILKCGHNAKYDIIILSHYDIAVKGLSFDSMVASYLLDPSLRQHNLDALALAHFNVKKIPTSRLIGSGSKQITMDMAPIEQVAEYACEDADITWRLWRLLEPQLEEKNLKKLMDKVEVPLIHVLAAMEKAGVAIDEPYMNRMSKELETELVSLEKKIYELAGVKFNINSPKQLGKVMFEDLGLPVIRKTKTGYSTDVSVLEELAKEHELPKQILEFRQFAKLKSTYVDALPKLIHPKTGRLHTSYNQTVAATGRLSSSDPNLQNIPIRTEIGRSIRAGFVAADDDHLLLDADYSQIELRIMAHLSGDQTLRDSFQNDEDVHRRTAALVFNVEPQDVTDEQRRKAKEVNFGIMYGMGAFGLSQRLGITPEEGGQFIEAYFANYPGVQKFMVDIVHQVQEKGYVTTLLNRRRYIPEIKSDNRRIRDFAERTAINTPIQGSAADLIKVAMIHVQKRMAKEGLASKMIMQVHDELVFDVVKEELPQMQHLVRQEMENAIKLDVPIKVDLGTGVNWLKAH
ncbi:DNA polymerase I [candidate division KSB1 bacterium]|nr:DNA polymerase I [candidate division KSB1 bacterium]RQW01300.1 MAG: DNA polymerase I [candidate division KSB1 bacterium]